MEEVLVETLVLCHTAEPFCVVGLCTAAPPSGSTSATVLVSTMTSYSYTVSPGDMGFDACDVAAIGSSNSSAVVVIAAVVASVVLEIDETAVLDPSCETVCDTDAVLTVVLGPVCPEATLENCEGKSGDEPVPENAEPTLVVAAVPIRCTTNGRLDEIEIFVVLFSSELPETWL